MKPKLTAHEIVCLEMQTNPLKTVKYYEEHLHLYLSANDCDYPKSQKVPKYKRLHNDNSCWLNHEKSKFARDARGYTYQLDSTTERMYLTKEGWDIANEARKKKCQQPVKYRTAGQSGEYILEPITEEK